MAPRAQSLLALDPHAGAFSEAPAWVPIGKGWTPLHGSFRDLGYSIEWHDFSADRDFNWTPSFHPSGLEICFNLEGHGEVQTSRQRLEFLPETGGYYFQSGEPLRGLRQKDERHRFLTVEFSRTFLAQQIAPKEKGLSDALKNFLAGKSATQVSLPHRLSHEQQQLVKQLNRPPVATTARRLWSHAKALEIAASVLYQPEVTAELFCERHKRQNEERVARVIHLLRENLADPPTLEEIGRRVGCSHFYLSRIFSQEMGRSIFQYLRALRMERAAELLRENKLNVTQVSLEVGYNSPSHFSTAFHETYGCCPGLYPLQTLDLARCR